MSTIGDDRRSRDQQLDELIEAARAGSQAALGELYFRRLIFSGWKAARRKPSSRWSDSRRRKSSGTGILQQCRRYLLQVAGRELAQSLRVKEAPSDLVQDVCVDAHAHFAQFQGRTQQELLAWLRGILQHRLAHTQRRYQQTNKRDIACEVNGNRAYQDDIQLHPVHPVPSPSTQAIDREREVRVLRALDLLSDDYRQAIVLHHRDGLPFAELARRMGRSEAAVRKLWTRAVQQLRVRLESDDARQ